MVEVEGGGEHDHALVGNTAVTVAQVELVDVEGVLRAVGPEHAHALEDVSHAAVIGAGVHVAGATDGPRDAAGELETREPELAGHLGGLLEADARLAGHLVVLHRDAHEVVAEGDDDAAIPLVGDEQVGTIAEHEVRNARLLALAQDVPNLLGIVRNGVQVGGTSDLEGGVLAHGFVDEDVLLAHDGTKPPGEGL